MENKNKIKDEKSYLFGNLCYCSKDEIAHYPWIVKECDNYENYIRNQTLAQVKRELVNNYREYAPKSNYTAGWNDALDSLNYKIKKIHSQQTENVPPSERKTEALASKTDQHASLSLGLSDTNTQNLKSCGQVVVGDEEFGKLRCGDPIGSWEGEDNNLVWVWDKEPLRCEKCKGKVKQ